MPTRVLFLCTGNSARSLLAEAFLRKYAESSRSVSAGLEPRPITDDRPGDEGRGIVIAHSTPKEWRSTWGKTLFQYLITVCDKAGEELPHQLAGVIHRLHWSFEIGSV